MRKRWVVESLFFAALEVHICKLSKLGVCISREEFSLNVKLSRHKMQALGRYTQVLPLASVRSQNHPSFTCVCPMIVEFSWDVKFTQNILFFMWLIGLVNTGWFGAHWVYWSLLELFFTKGIVLLWRLNEELLARSSLVATEEPSSKPPVTGRNVEHLDMPFNWSYTEK